MTKFLWASLLALATAPAFGQQSATTPSSPGPTDGALIQEPQGSDLNQPQFSELDEDGSGGLDRAEAAAAGIGPQFDTLDADGDGELTEFEFSAESETAQAPPDHIPSTSVPGGDTGMPSYGEPSTATPGGDTGIPDSAGAMPQEPGMTQPGEAGTPMPDSQAQAPQDAPMPDDQAQAPQGEPLQPPYGSDMGTESSAQAPSGLPDQAGADSGY